MFTKRKLAQVEMLLALALWGVGLTGAAWGGREILQWLFFFAWYPLILFLDGLLFRLRGSSWLLNRPRDLARMAFWSVTVWLVFEAFNLVLKNWGYTGVIANPWVRWPGYALAFATVLPGVLLGAEVLAALGAFKGCRGQGATLSQLPRVISFSPLSPQRGERVRVRGDKEKILTTALAQNWEPLSLLLGTACLVLPLAWPRYFFPLVWVAGFFLLDPFVQLLGGRSLIAAWLRGERREHLCLLTAGLLCGLWWEAWNYPATSRWVYTLPVLNFAKVFEMPILGFLGFPPFALGCAVMYNFMRMLDERVLVTSRRCRYAMVIQLAFWLIMFAAIDSRTVMSFQ